MISKKERLPLADAGLRQLFTKHLPHWHWQHVETPMTGVGIPDSAFCAGPTLAGWIEFKKADALRVVTMKPKQCAWLERYARYGGRCFIGVRAAKGDELWLLHPCAGRVLLSQPLTAVGPAWVLGRWRGGPNGWQWPKIATIMAGTIPVSP